MLRSDRAVRPIWHHQVFSHGWNEAGSRRRRAVSLRPAGRERANGDLFIRPMAG